VRILEESAMSCHGLVRKPARSGGRMETHGKLGKGLLKVLRIVCFESASPGFEFGLERH